MAILYAFETFSTASTLRKLFFERLDEALGDPGTFDFDHHYWGNVFFDGIDPLLSTPRDITRLCNAISVTFPAVRGEVNPVDFIAIEALRVFTPSIFHIIRLNEDEFTGPSGSSDGGKKETRQEFHKSYLADIDKSLHDPLKILLQRLFPKLEAVWGNINYGSDHLSDWRRNRRVCSPDVFPVYFRLELPEGAIGSQDILNFLSDASNPEIIADRLVSLSKQADPSGTTKAHILLYRLEDYTQEAIKDNDISPLLISIFNVSDELRSAEPESKGPFGFGIESQIGRIIFQLLKRLKSEQRFKLLREIFETSKGIATCVREVSIFGQMHGKYGAEQPSKDEEQLVTLEELKELEQIMSDRITKEASSGQLIFSIDLAVILIRWKEWETKKEAEKWIQNMGTNENFIVSLLTSMLGVSYSQGLGMFGLGDRVSRRTYRINIDSVRNFVDPDSIAPIVEKILIDRQLSDRERLALEEFNKSLKEYREKDKDKK